MAQLPVGSPFGEHDLGDEPGFHPVHPGPGQAADRFEGRLRPLEGGQGGMQAGQGAPVEAGADLAGVPQLAVAVVVAQQQRPGANVRLRRGAGGVPARLGGRFFSRAGAGRRARG